MARLTREESRERTRAALLDVATEHFLDRGYADTSVDRIAEEAGYSKGAVYSNFGGKDELCRDVIRGIRAHKLTEAAQLTVNITSVDTFESAVRQWCEHAIGDRRWALLEMEFGARGRVDPVIEEEIRASNRQLRAAAAYMLADFARRLDVELADTPEKSADIVVGLCLGIGVQRAFDPDISIEDLVHTIVRHVITT